jgi:hypothetical protein
MEIRQFVRRIYIHTKITIPLLVFSYKSKAVPLHAMEAHGGEDIQLPLILDVGTRWG